MARRPVFVPAPQGNEPLVEEIPIDFRWNPGMAPSQKLKNVLALHEAAEEVGIGSVLEVSTKSPHSLGRALSAFNLSFESAERGRITVEAAFQGSKVFERGGPHPDMYAMTGTDLKKDLRLRASGHLTLFRFEGKDWPSEPKTAFYNWLYVNALAGLTGVEEELRNFGAFSDIEFNPTRSVNCQARSCALFVSLERRHLLHRALGSREAFVRLTEPGRNAGPSGERTQPGLFEEDRPPSGHA